MEQQEKIKKKYNNSPLVEVMCEFVFESNLELTQEKISLLDDLYIKDFPSYEEFVLETYAFNPTRKGINKVLNSKTFFRYFDDNKNFFIQFSSDLFTINKLKPYEGWETFKPKINDNLNKYLEVTKPLKIKSIRLKYINIINIKEKMIQLRDYFEFFPNTPDEMNPIGYFQLNSGIPYNEDASEILDISLKSSPDKDCISIILDLEYKSSIEHDIDLNNIDLILEKAHDIIEDNFELCLTNESRKLFEEVIYV